MPGPDLISAADAAELVGVSKMTFLRAMHAGEIKAYQYVGNQYLFKRSDVEAYAKTRGAK